MELEGALRGVVITWPEEELFAQSLASLVEKVQPAFRVAFFVLCAVTGAGQMLLSTSQTS